MKIKVSIKNKKDVSKWICVCNLMAKSMCDHNIAISQFNALSPSDRITIKKRLNECDEIRKTKIPNTEQDAWIIGIMVDAHIIAYEYDIDPLTVLLCINPICKPNEKLIVK
ncbi:MAG: hypothetical protein IKT37_04815 [Clostridia bacterium]|nr:hypothetical protein [Clostridia bacterium]